MKTVGTQSKIKDLMIKMDRLKNDLRTLKKKTVKVMQTADKRTSESAVSKIQASIKSK